MTAVSCIVAVFVVARQAVEGLSDTTSRPRSFETETTSVGMDAADSSIRGGDSVSTSRGKWALNLGRPRKKLESD